MGQTLSPAILGGIGTGIQAAGQIQSGRSARKVGESQQRAAEFEAQQLDTNAEQTQAVSQRAAMEEQRKSMALQSRAIAIAAASGGGALDPTVMALVGNLSKEGQLAAETQIYGGEERARAMRNQAKASRYEGAQRAEAGRIAERASKVSAGSTILSGVMKDWTAYGFQSGTYKAPISEATTTRQLRD